MHFFRVFSRKTHSIIKTINVLMYFNSIESFVLITDEIGPVTNSLKKRVWSSYLCRSKNVRFPSSPVGTPSAIPLHRYISLEVVLLPRTRDPVQRLFVHSIKIIFESLLRCHCGPRRSSAYTGQAELIVT